MSENHYTSFAKAKSYTKQYELDTIDSIVTRQEDGMLGYISAGQFATTGSNIFTGGQIVLGNITITGDITAQNFVTSSTLLFTGSTNHGSLIGDIHTYTGSVRITGSLNVIGGINGEINATNGIVSSSAQIKNYGDFATTGSNTFIGNQTITGSFLVSGSTTQIGNNNLYGNTWLYGTVDVSGSTNFHNHTITMTGSMFTSGSQIITGSLDIKGNVNVSSGSEFYLAGNKLFNYGAFYDTRTQSGSANVSQSIQFNSTDYSHGVSISNNSRVVLENVGVYNIQFSAQIVDTGAGDSTIHIWIKKNGQNVPNSAGRIFLKANQETIASWNYIVPATSPNDYYELVWQSTDADARILYEGATGNIPAIPSIILTVTQVA